METMKEIPVNVNGKGAMQLVTALRPMKDGQVPAGGDVVFTSGEDGVLFVTDLATESSVYQVEVCDGFIPSFVVTPEQNHVLIASDDDCTVASYSLPPDCHLDELLRRSTVAIRQVTCSPQFIAIVDEEPVVRVLLRSNLEQVILAEGSTGVIKSVVLDPQEKYLCTSSEDATVRVFALDVPSQCATVAKIFKIKHGNIRHDDVLLRCAWQPGEAGKLLAVPMDKGIVELFGRDTWEPKIKLMLPIGKSTAADVDVLAFSPNGRYLAAATCAKEVFVWELETQTVLRSFKIDYQALGVQFANKSNALVVYHIGGKLAFVKDVVPPGHTPPQHMIEQSFAAGASTLVVKAPKQGERKHEASDLVSDETEVDGKREADNDEEMSFDDDNEARVEAIKASFGFGSAAKTVIDEHVEDDKNSLTSRPSKKLLGQSVSPLRTITEPFQPGSVMDTSGRGSSATSLLAWTPEGEIEVIRGAGMSEHLVKVDFADKSRRGFKFNDNYMFSLAFLDDYGAIFAAPRRAREDWEDFEADADKSNIVSSFIFYRPFESWASNSSWHKALPEGEDAECVAAGREFCAVATSLHTLRIYTSSGLEYALMRLAGRVVTMTAKESLLAVVYQGLHGQMLYQLLRITVGSLCDRVKLLSKGELPMTPPPRDVFASHKENDVIRESVSNWAQLTWLGFDDRQILYAVDSFSCIQALSPCSGWNWFPIGCVGNTLQKKPEDRHGVFTLGVVNDSLLYFPLEKSARAPKLRGSHRPVPGMFPLRTASFPKTSKQNDDVSNGQVWQNVRICGLESIASESNADKNVADQVVHEQAEMDKALILMMKTACTNDEPARVLDLAKCLHLEKSHQIAQKLAIHFSLRQLQSQLYELYRVKFEEPQRLNQASRIPTSSQLPRQPASYRSSQEEEAPEPREMEPLRRARSLLSRPLSTPSRDESRDKEAGFTEDVQESKPSALPKAASTKESAGVERSMAPANPFLKKPGGSSASPSGGKGEKKTGLQRMAKFASPPPTKKQCRSTWNK